MSMFWESIGKLKDIISLYSSNFPWTKVSGILNQGVEEILRSLYYLLIDLFNSLF